MPCRACLTLALLLAALAAGPALTQPAEEETVLLTITGDLIDTLDNLPANAAPDQVISGYYALLPTALQQQLAALRRNMDRRSEDYQVAFRAADTAEVNEIVDDLSDYWTAIRQVHAQEFTEQAINRLTAAYSELYELIGSGN